MTLTAVRNWTLGLATDLEKCLWLVGLRQFQQLAFFNQFPSITHCFPIKLRAVYDWWFALQILQLGRVGGFASLNKTEKVDTCSWSLVWMNGGFLLSSLPLLGLRLFGLGFVWRFLSPASLDTTCQLRNLKNNLRSILSSGVSASSNSQSLISLILE